MNFRILTKFTGTIIAIALCLTTHAQPLVITPLEKDFYIFTTWQVYDGEKFPANGMYMLTTAGAVLIDCPWDPLQYQSLLDSIEIKHHQKVTMVIATHFHNDRTGGFAYYASKGIATWSSAKTKTYCQLNKVSNAENIFVNDTSFVVGDKKFETFFPGAGHSADNIVLWFSEQKVLYGGCFVKSTMATGLGNLGDADISQWPLSIKKVMTKFPKPKWVIPGHEGWQNSFSLEHTLSLLKSK